MSDVTMDLNGDDMMGGGRPLKSKKKKKYLWPVLMVVIIVFLVLVVKLDIGKISSKYIAPKIKDIPIINKVLPKAKEEDPYSEYSNKQFIDIINGSELELEQAYEEIENQSIEILNLEKKIADLQVFEDEHLRFKEDKRMFDESVGNMNSEDFIQFYQKMYPENAENVYAQIVQVQQMTKEQRQYASLISEMDEISAAKVLENLFQTDMDIILSILTNMEIESASAILEEMDSKIASTIVKQLSPE